MNTLMTNYKNISIVFQILLPLGIFFTTIYFFKIVFQIIRGKFFKNNLQAFLKLTTILLILLASSQAVKGIIRNQMNPYYLTIFINYCKQFLNIPDLIIQTFAVIGTIGFIYFLTGMITTILAKSLNVIGISVLLVLASFGVFIIPDPMLLIGISALIAGILYLVSLFLNFYLIIPITFLVLSTGFITKLSDFSILYVYSFIGTYLWLNMLIIEDKKEEKISKPKKVEKQKKKEKKKVKKVEEKQEKPKIKEPKPEQKLSLNIQKKKKVIKKQISPKKTKEKKRRLSD